nr:hypothetical protein [Methylomarinum sp. Ch1-1]MDP4519772.1 hypothetical protein [Methylomarinum sp. Ch1-1]
MNTADGLGLIVASNPFWRHPGGLPGGESTLRLAFGCASQREAHQKWCASSRQHTLPAPVGRIKRSGSAIVGRLREASRQNPPPGKNWPLCVSRWIAWRRIHPTGNHLPTPPPGAKLVLCESLHCC